MGRGRLGFGLCKLGQNVKGFLHVAVPGVGDSQSQLQGRIGRSLRQVGNDRRISLLIDQDFGQVVDRI